ncbi:MAG: hypothetical protein K2Y39_02685 [Candidatus Obscuribacterales bacterium]|nr:hypothetical protein [Candidatus Obscuribacterales bacterium]
MAKQQSGQTAKAAKQQKRPNSKSGQTAKAAKQQSGQTAKAAKQQKRLMQFAQCNEPSCHAPLFVVQR